MSLRKCTLHMLPRTITGRSFLTGIHNSDVIPRRECVGLLERDLARDVYVEQVHLHAIDSGKEMYNCKERTNSQESSRPELNLLWKNLHIAIFTRYTPCIGLGMTN